MRVIISLLVLIVASFSLQAQPIKSMLTGPVIKNADTLNFEPAFDQRLEFLPSQTTVSTESNSLFSAPQTKPGVAFLSSAILPGSGQAMNGKWGRAAIYFLAEAASIAYYLNQNAQARDNERDYEAYADQNWSVLAYAQWLVDYSRANGLNEGLSALDQLESQVAGQNPDFDNTTNDWSKVNLTLLRTVEVNTRFIFDNPAGCGSNDPPNCQIKSQFSHVVQNYGSQQYYELMSKYYQFQPGWQDFHEQRIADGTSHTYQYTWNRDMITLNFIEGRDQAERFNENYRRAGNILNLLVVNHVISAFDAFFTVKLKNSRLETQANLIGDESVSLIWHF